MGGMTRHVRSLSTGGMVDGDDVSDPLHIFKKPSMPEPVPPPPAPTINNESVQAAGDAQRRLLSATGRQTNIKAGELGDEDLTIKRNRLLGA